MIRNLLLIVIDCLRADHLACYGYPRPTSSTIDALAQRGVRWQNAYSASCWTKPSVASVFTGRYPSCHGALEGVKRREMGADAATDAIQSGTPTLAEDLSNRGRRCAAFHNNLQIAPFTRLDRGFDVYNSEAGGADGILAAFADWLARQNGEKWFAYLHFLEAHWPYKPRRRHVQMFGGDRDTNPFRDFRARDYGRLRKAIRRHESSLTAAEISHMTCMYDGAVRRLDGKINQLLKLLERMGQQDATAVVVTADHGEEFFEHGQIGHGHSLYEELIRVPLIVSWPSGPSGWVIERPVSHVDLGHTLAKLLDGPTDLPGQDLLSSAHENRPVCAEAKSRSRYKQSLRLGPWKLHRTYALPDGETLIFPARTSHDGACTAPPPPRLELYNLRSDPGERTDLSDHIGLTGVREELTFRLDEWSAEIYAQRSGSDTGEATIDARVVHRLRDLGYLD